MRDVPPREPVPLDEVARRFPTLRQSLLAKHDDCALSTLFELKFARGWNTHPQARGTVFHLFAAKVLQTLRDQQSTTIPVHEAEQILVEACRQLTDSKGQPIPARNVVRVPLRQMPELRMAARKFASDNSFSHTKITSIEERLRAPLRYVDDQGEVRTRMLTGQLDALLYEAPDGAIVIDWKDTWALPPEPKEKGPDDYVGEDDELAGISYHGYFQQRFYGWLVMMNYSNVNRVTLREFYARKTKARKATLTRDRMPEVEEELRVLVEAFDRAMASGEPPWPYGYWPAAEDGGRVLDIDRLGLWKPQPGKHCLGGETRILTDRGARELRDCEGESVRVLDRHGRWSEATVQSFGAQPLVRVTFDDGSVVRATPDHRWWTVRRDRRGRWVQTNERVTTMELDRAPLAMFDETPGIDPEGVRHGYTYGDGWLRRDRGTCVARIMPQDAGVAAYFERVRWRANGQGFVYGLPGHYKALPIAPTPEYARGFVAGLHAADGKVDRHGGVLIHCEGRGRAEGIAEVARLAGCVVSSVRLDSDKPTNLSAVGTVTRELMAIRLKPAAAPVLKGYHRARLRNVNQMRGMYRRVVSVDPDGFEEVYCAVVPGAESFTLASGVVTSNCGFCAASRHCPIEEDARIEAGGAITSWERAKRAAAELQVVERVRKVLIDGLKGFVETQGSPVPIKHSKGRRVIGWYMTKRGRRFGLYTPDESDRGGHADLDAQLAEAMREATARARAEKPKRQRRGRPGKL